MKLSRASWPDPERRRKSAASSEANPSTFLFTFTKTHTATPLMSSPSSAIEWAQLILARRPRSGGGWSLCEIRLTAAEFASLTAWGQNLSLDQFSMLSRGRAPFEISGQKYKGSSILGLVLLLLESETARRQATEGMVWACIRSLGWSEEVGACLFNSQGGASVLHRLLLQEAAETFNLRHLFGQEGVHSWIDSIFLQFGFTKRGAFNRLGTWLHSPQVPVAVSQLLLSSSASPEFKELWNCLKKVSREKIHSEPQRRLLENSPWILPEWSADLLAAAKKAQAPSHDWLDESGEGHLVESVRLIQTREGEAAAYAFEVNLGNPNALDLTEPAYRIFWNNDAVGFLQLEQGSYQLSGGRLMLPATRADGELVLQAPNAAGPALRQRLELWDPNDIVTVFSLAGGRLEDSCQGGLRTGFHLIYHACVQLRGRAQSRARLSEHWWCATVIPPAVELQLCTEEGELLWDASWVSAASSAAACPGLRAEWKSVGGTSFEEGKPAVIRLSLPDGLSLVSAHFNGRRLAVGQTPENPGLLEVVLESADFLHTPRLRVGVRIGANRYSVVLAMEDLWVKAVFMENPEGQVLRYPVEVPLRSGEAKASRFKFPELWGPTMKPVLMEGHRIVAEVDFTRPQRLSGLSGYGAPLSLVRDRFNAHTPQSRFIVADKVRNTDGLLRSVKDTGAEISLWLYHERQPCAEDSVLLLDSAGVWHTVPSTQIVVDAALRQWTIPVGQRGMPPVVCVAVLYKETALGAWQHPTEFRRLLEAQEEPEQVRAFAGCIRAFKLPFLETCSQRVYRAWIYKNLPTVLAVWLCPFRLELGASCLREGYPEDLWLEAVQEFFSTYVVPLSVADARTLVAKVAGVSPSGLGTIDNCLGVLGDALRLLMEVSPWLAAHAVREVLQACQAPAGEQKKAQLLLARIADCPEDVWAQCSLKMQVDERFWSRLASQAARHGANKVYLEGADAWNVAVALKTPAFRRRVGALILKASN